MKKLAILSNCEGGDGRMNKLTILSHCEGGGGRKNKAFHNLHSPQYLENLIEMEHYSTILHLCKNPIKRR